MKHSEYYKTVIEYCNSIISKKIKAGIYVIKACKRFLEDIKKTKEEGNLFYFNENKFNEFCEFAEALYIPDTGKRLKLLSWQLFIYANLYGFYYKDNRGQVYNGQVIKNTGLSKDKYMAGSLRQTEALQELVNHLQQNGQEVPSSIDIIITQEGYRIKTIFNYNEDTSNLPAYQLQYEQQNFPTMK